MKVLAALLMVAVSSPALAAGEKTSTEKKDRVICKRDVKTASRMNAARICRTYSQWKEQATSGAAVDEAADTLELIGEKISTNDVGGMGEGTPQ